jgi:hypothetical protein
VPYVLRPTLLRLTFGLAFAIGGCSVEQVKKAGPEVSATSHVILYPAIDSELGEHRYLNEKPIAELLSVVIEDSIRKQYNPGSARRDAPSENPWVRESAVPCARNASRSAG